MSNHNIWFRAKGRYDQFLGPNTEGNYSKQHFSSNRSVPPVLATPASFHNCEVQYEGRAQQFVPSLPPKLQLDFTVITGVRPARLTNIIGLNAQSEVRMEIATMLSPGQPHQRTAPRSWGSAKMHFQKNNGLVAANNQPAKTYAITKQQYFATQRLRCKVNYTQQAELSFCSYAGFQRHSSRCLVSNFTYTFNASDFAASQVSSLQLEGSK